MEKADRTKILIMDNQQVVIEGIKSFLEAYPGFEVVGEVQDPIQALKAIESLKPDVLILDTPLPEDAAEGFIRRVRKSARSIKLIFFSSKRSKDNLSGLFSAGIHAFVQKEATPPELVLAIEAVLKEKRFGESTPSVILRKDFIQSFRNGEDIKPGLEGLTRRQREILRYLAEGKPTKEIALIMGISPKTVETHRHRLMQKLGAESISELIMIAVKYRLVHV